MDIKGINNQFQYSKNVKKSKLEKTEKKSSKDKLEISDKGKVLSNSKKDEAKKIDEITKKIESKYYNSDDVIGKVADKILKDIKPE